MSDLAPQPYTQFIGHPRVFGDDVTRCPRCDDHLRVLAFLTDPAVTTAIVDHLGIRSDRPRLAPARAPPEPAQAEFDLGC